MKVNFVKLLLAISALLPTLVFAQTQAPVLPTVNSIDPQLKAIRDDAKIDVDSAFKILSNWSGYPAIQKTGRDYIIYYNDSEIGNIPMRVYIPSGYKNTVRTGCVMMLHGAVGISHFKDIDSLYKFDSDALIDNLKKQNYIVIRPVGDGEKKFSWVVNKYAGRKGDEANLTFNKLKQIIVTLKRILNVDDNKIFALGHSDGSDGAVGLGVFGPGQFAGIIAYNSMLDNIFAKDFYIRNIQNRPLYLVHSDLDDLRPIQQARIIVDSLRQTDKNILYKEYIGYKHEDKHLDKDMPLACLFMKGISRNPFSPSIYWETLRGDIYNGCDWLRLNKVDTALQTAVWHHMLSTKAYNKTDKTWYDPRVYKQYGFVKKSAAAKAFFNNNTFTIETSGVTEIEILISPVMANLEEPVTIVVNGKQLFKQKIKADKNFMLNSFENTMDRQALWVNSIKVKVD